MVVLLGVLRRPEGLVALVSRRAEAFSAPASGEPDTSLGPCNPYTEALVPLTNLPASDAEQATAVQTAWDSLASVHALDQRALIAVIQLLWGTVLDPDASCTASLPREAGLPPERPRRTAARPRGYLGTKVKPPKLPSARPFDLRPILCSPVGLGDLLERFAATFAELRPLLEGQFPPVVLDRLDDTAAIRRDPWSWSWRSTTPKRSLSLPRIFQRTMLGPVQHLEWSEIGELVTTYWALGLNDDAALRRCVSRLLAQARGRAGLRWASLLRRELSDRRSHIAELIIESGVLTALPEGPDDRQLQGLLRLSQVSADPVYRHRMHHALRILQHPGRLDLLLEGSALANRFSETAHLDDRWPPPEEEVEVGAEFAVNRFMDRIAHCEGLSEWERSGFAVELWRRCLTLPGLTALLGSDSWSVLDPRSAFEVCRTLTDVVHDHELVDGTRGMKWEILRAAAPRWIGVLERLPLAHRKKTLDCLAEVIFRYDRPETLRGGLRGAEAVVPLLCNATCSMPTHVGEPLAVLLGPEVSLDRLMTAPVESWRALDRSAARKNDARIIARGLSTLCARIPGLIEDGLVSAPNQLLSAAKVLGVMPEGAGVRLLDSISRDKILGARVAELDVRELAQIVDKVRAPSGSSPVRRRLRAALRGEASLTAVQLEGHRRRILEALPALRLASIQHRALDALGAFLNAPEALADESVRHAVMMQWSVAEHRRSLRRVIRARIAGDRGYPSTHPRNKAWLAAHPRIDPRVWLEGITVTGELPALGRVVLSIETDPLEVLRIGTHAGTCLGLGGGQAYSAAAIMLDVNKAVVFARAGNEVVARQVLAISADDQLVPFSVYPESASPALCTLFKSFDESLAKALGVPLYLSSKDPEPTIELVLAQDWWDDGAWDLVVPEPKPEAAHR